MNYVLATVKSWNIEAFETLRGRYPEHNFTLLTASEDLTQERLDAIKPEYVFFPHWSWIIPKTVYENFDCVVFHMTDLPFGRGGSPLQNLLERGVYRTKISAIRAQEGLDTGDIYFKEPFDLSEGNADELFKRASRIIYEKMIPRFLGNRPAAFAQEGEIVTFRRRTPAQSEMPESLSPRRRYDFIRMLDGEGYPPAFIRYGNGRVTFKNARIDGTKVLADAVWEEDAL